jgi:type VII secretion protein EccB
MATRRDELSAHTFARKRMLAAFLQPESRVSDEEAPRPVRAFMPSAVMSVVLVAGCIAWGAISPSAPPGWDKTGEYIIVDSDSTTRYVVLSHEENGKKIKQLHPVLNFASAKLVLNKGKGEVIEVSGEDIDESDIARGATIGIPYAPDRLPKKKDAETAKEWAVCEKTGLSGQPQQGVFVLGGQDEKALQDENRLGEGEALYVEGPDGKRYIVDGNGTLLLLQGQNAADRELLTKLVLKNPPKPQKVSKQWLETLHQGAPIKFPTLGALQGTEPQFEEANALPLEARKVGMVLKSPAGGTTYYYVVLKDHLQQTTPLWAKLMMGGLDLQQKQKPYPVSPVKIASAGATNTKERGDTSWPEDVMVPVNHEAEGVDGASRRVSCSVYTGEFSPSGLPELAAWAGPDYPANIVDGSTRAYVSPGTGLLYQERSGTGGGGRQYLLTDSGLRYALGSKARTRLGYAKAKVRQVPQHWSELLPKGPTLDTESASQEQGL